MAFPPRPKIQVVFPAPGHRIALDSGETVVVAERLGKGAFGIVHAASDDFGNQLVLKTLSPTGRTYQQAKEDWEREFTALSILRHPHITHVYGWCEHNNAFSIVIELCGGTLEQLRPRCRLDRSRAEDNHLDHLR